MFFSCFFHVIKKIIKCQCAFLPILSIAFIIITIYLSGLIFNNLNIGFAIIVVVSIIGFVDLVIHEKLNFGHYFLFQNRELWIFYMLMFCLLLQNINCSKEFIQPDEIHHWGFIVKGLLNYNALDGFKNSYSNYTMGGALWAYFCLKLAGLSFKIDLTLFATTLITLACFMPGLSLIKLKKVKIFLIPLIVMIGVFLAIGNFKISLFCLLILLGMVVVNFFLSGVDSTKQIFLFLIWFLLFTFLSLMPGYEYVSYRTMTPDHVIYVLSGSFLCAYIAKPNFKTILTLSPILCLPYLFKRPGEFISISVSVAAILHCTLLHFKYIVKIIANSTKYYKHIFLVLSSLICVLLFIIIPPIIWNEYCKNNNRTSMFKFENTSFSLRKICDPLFSDDNEDYIFIRKSFKNKLINKPIFVFKYDGILSYCLSSIKIINKWMGIKSDNKITYPHIFLFCFLSFIILCLFYRGFFLKSYYLLFLIVLIFTVLHVLGVLVNYSLFKIGNSLPAFERYISPMLKLLCLTSVLLWLRCCLYGFRSNKLSFCVSVIVFIISLLLYNASDKNFHTKKFICHYNQLGKLLSKELPKGLDLTDKNLLVVSPFDTVASPIRDFSICATVLYYNDSFPKGMRSIKPYDKRLDDFILSGTYDYLWWHFDQDVTFGSNITNSVNEKLLSLLSNQKRIDNSSFYTYSVADNDYLMMSVASNVFNNLIFNNDGYWTTEKNKYKIQQINLEEDRCYLLLSEVKSRSFDYTPWISIGDINSFYWNDPKGDWVTLINSFIWASKIPNPIQFKLNISNNRDFKNIRFYDCGYY